MIVSNIGATPDFSAIYTTNSAMHTAFVQVSLNPDHKIGSYEYMARVKHRIETDLPELSAYFQSGGLVDAVLNLGLPAPIDVQVAGSNMDAAYATALKLSSQIRNVSGVADVFIPQDIDYPALQLDVDRTRASELGLDQQEVVDNVITALTSNQMIAPSFWIDPKTGNDYMLTVQYPEDQVKTLTDLKSIPLRAASYPDPTRLDMISNIRRMKSPTEVDHYKLRRTIDIYVRPLNEDLSRIANSIDDIIAKTKVPEGLSVSLQGMVQGMRSSFTRFALGLCLAVVLLYLILVAQFQSFVDPFIILLAVPPGLSGVILILWLSGTTLNVMSLMGVVMLVGIAVSNSILIVEFTRHLRSEGMAVREAVAMACRVRLRPVLMTSLATIIGLDADGVEAGRRQRGLCAAGPRDSRRLKRFRGPYGFPRAGCLRVGLRARVAGVCLRQSLASGFLKRDAHVGVVRIAFAVALEHHDPDEILRRVGPACVLNAPPWPNESADSTLLAAIFAGSSTTQNPSPHGMPGRALSSPVCLRVISATVAGLRIRLPLRAPWSSII